MDRPLLARADRLRALRRPRAVRGHAGADGDRPAPDQRAGPAPQRRRAARRPAWLSDWVGWLAAKNPAERPQSAVQAWEALEEMLLAQLGPRWRHGAQLLELDGRHKPSFSEQPTAGAGGSAACADRPAAAAASRDTAAAGRPPPRLQGRRAGRRARGLRLRGRSPWPGARDSRALSRRLPPRTEPPPRSPLPAASSAELRSRAASVRALADDYDRSADRIGKRRTGSRADAQLVSELRKVARDYRAAGTAADRGDLAAYTAALTAAEAGQTAVAARLDAAERSATRAPKAKRKPAPKPTPPPKARVRPQSPKPVQTQPVPTQPAAPEPAPTPCSGDSVSDDPSDEDCGGEA